MSGPAGIFTRGDWTDFGHSATCPRPGVVWRTFNYCSATSTRTCIACGATDTVGFPGGLTWAELRKERWDAAWAAVTR